MWPWMNGNVISHLGKIAGGVAKTKLRPHAETLCLSSDMKTLDTIFCIINLNLLCKNKNQSKIPTNL